MGLIRDDLKLPLIRQVRRLARRSDPRIAGLCAALLTLDVLLVAIFASHRVYSALHDYQVPRLGRRLAIGQDWSYAELLGYVKLTIIVTALIRCGKGRAPIYLALATVFAVVLLDDALRLHERLGPDLASILALPRPLLGELLVWMSLGAFPVAVSAFAFARSPLEDRSNGVLLLGAFAVLVFFAVGVDLAHVAILGTFRYRVVDSVLTILEDGGEQLTLSLTCFLALLIQREARLREARGTAQDVVPHS
jgi:hypothetical protein